LLWWPFLVLTDLTLFSVEVGCNGSANACHDFVSGPGVFRSHLSCWSSQMGPSIFSLCCKNDNFDQVNT
jgi:hypothetical protein